MLCFHQSRSSFSTLIDIFFIFFSFERQKDLEYVKDSNLTTVYTPSHGINFCPSSSVSMKNAYNLSLMFVFDVVPQKGQVPPQLN